MRGEQAFETTWWFVFKKGCFPNRGRTREAEVVTATIFFVDETATPRSRKRRKLTQALSIYRSISSVEPRSERNPRRSQTSPARLCPGSLYFACRAGKTFYGGRPFFLNRLANIDTYSKQSALCTQSFWGLVRMCFSRLLFWGTKAFARREEKPATSFERSIRRLPGAHKHFNLTKTPSCLHHLPQTAISPLVSTLPPWNRQV